MNNMEKLTWNKVLKEQFDSIPHDAGVYVLSVLLKSKNYGVIYVGQSIDLKTRIEEHFSTSEVNEELKNYLQNKFSFKVSYAKCDRHLLDKIEKYLINFYQPFCNDKEGNGNETLECSLPNVIRWSRNK